MRVLGSQVPVAWVQVRADIVDVDLLFHAGSAQTALLAALPHLADPHVLLPEVGLRLGPRELLAQSQGGHCHL